LTLNSMEVAALQVGDQLLQIGTLGLVMLLPFQLVKRGFQARN